jgi:UDP-glucose 4-epimerase
VNVLVTGSSGYIGNFLVDAILSRTEHFCFGIDIQPPTFGKDRGAKYSFFECDIRNSQKISNYVERMGIEVVFHLAGLKSVQDSFEKPELYHEVNALASAEFANICSNLGVKQFNFASSAAVYGSRTSEKKSEQSPVLPTSPYGDSKLKAEIGILNAVRHLGSSGMKVQILRYFNVVGNSPRWSNSNLFDIIWGKIRDNEKLTIYGDKHPTIDGSCVRDYIDIHDLVLSHVNDVFFNSTESSIYNLGSGIGNSVFEVVRAFEEVFETKIGVDILDSRNGEADLIVADNSKAKIMLDLKISHDLIHSVKSYL